jgi:hypothetical protein
MKRSRKTKQPDPEEGFNWRALLMGLTVFAFLTVFFYWVYIGRVTSSDYEGKIVDRWADQAPSTQTTQPYFRLVVESSDGKRFTVKVDPNVYDSARVGMRIRSKNGQVVLIEPNADSRPEK